MKKYIIVKWFECSIKDKSLYGYNEEMIVKMSSHKRFIEGTRFDFGFLHIATVNDGYSVTILPK